MDKKGFTNAEPKIGGKVLVVTHCAKKKRDVKQATPQLLYLSKRIERVYRIAKSYGAQFGVISAKYGLVLEDEQISLYEKTIETGHDVDRIVAQISEKLKERGAWNWLIYFGTAKNYITAFYCAAWKAGYGSRTFFVGRNSMGGLDELKRILLQSCQHLIYEYI